MYELIMAVHGLRRSFAMLYADREYLECSLWDTIKSKSLL